MGRERAETASDGLRDRIGAHLAPGEGAGDPHDERHHRVKMRTRDWTEA
jgi:hypothetical protein